MNNIKTNLPKKILHVFDKLLDKIYGSSVNPVYYTGTISVALLLIVIISGFYLFIFYNIATPYESVVNIQNQIVGRIVRSLHRYATDLSLITVFLHLTRMFVDVKTFGSRTLSWLSGFVLLGFLFLSAFTGYILVWDQHALLLANAGAKLLNIIPVFTELPSRTFSGEVKLDNSFFFINLFMHIALPFIMSLGLWIHTIKISSVPWLPSKKKNWSIFAILLIISIVYPLKLMPKADFLHKVKYISIDWFYEFWLPINNKFDPIVLWVIGLLLFLLFIFVPFWWRPKYLTIKKTASNENFCKACKQCTYDCPYQAISIMKIDCNKNSRFIAKVDSKLCVSCGICAASCDLLHMGPYPKKAIQEMGKAKEFISINNIDKNSIIFICCSSLIFKKDELKLLVGSESEFKYFFYYQDCIGSLHMKTLSILTKISSGVFIISCPSKMCQNHDSPKLFQKRFKKEEKLHDKVHFLNSGINDVNFFIKQKDDFLSYLKNKGKHPKFISLPSRFLNRIIGFLFSVLFCLIIAYIPNIAYQFNGDSSFLRLSWRLAGQKIEVCKKTNFNKLKKIPKHMRNPSGVCVSKSINYNLLLKIDNKTIIDRIYLHHGLKGDGAIFVLMDIPVSSGLKNISLSFLPIFEKSIIGAAKTNNLDKLYFNKMINFKTREVKLISINSANKKLIVL